MQIKQQDKPSQNSEEKGKSWKRGVRRWQFQKTDWKMVTQLTAATEEAAQIRLVTIKDTIDKGSQTLLDSSRILCLLLKSYAHKPFHGWQSWLTVHANSLVPEAVGGNFSATSCISQHPLCLGQATHQFSSMKCTLVASRSQQLECNTLFSLLPAVYWCPRWPWKLWEKHMSHEPSHPECLWSRDSSNPHPKQGTLHAMCPLADL